MGFRMGAGFAFVAVFVLASTTATTATTATATASSSAARIVVGGSQHWHFGFNYTDWALKAAPFHQNDTLVFMYDPPNGTTFPHSVYRLKNLRRFLACDLKNATLVGSATQGGGKGLEFVLRKRKPHYFACGVGAGYHCRAGLMKFAVLPKRPCQ